MTTTSLKPSFPSHAVDGAAAEPGSQVVEAVVGGELLGVSEANVVVSLVVKDRDIMASLMRLAATTGVSMFMAPDKGRSLVDTSNRNEGMQ